MSSVEWSVSYLPQSDHSDESDTSDDDDDDGLYGPAVKHSTDLNSSSYIVFDSDSKSKVDSDETVEISETDTEEKSSSVSTGRAPFFSKLIKHFYCPFF